MEIFTLLKAGIKKRFGTLFGVFLLVAAVTALLCSVLALWGNSNEYMDSELDRSGYGNITAWVSGKNISVLTGEIENISEVKKVDPQKIIFTNYEANDTESDSEGQLILFENNKRYKFFKNDLSGYTDAPEIHSGEVYVSPSMCSIMNISIGDEIIFRIARNGKTKSLTVTGFYEDPFMGSSMIGMKGFLVSESDFAECAEIIDDSEIDALARQGEMLHIKCSADINASELNTLLNEKTSLPQHTEFVHSKSAISGFMLILQNIFSGILIAFSAVLLLVTLFVIGHSLTSSIEADYVNMGILKTVGVTSKTLRKVQLLQYGIFTFCGIFAGLLTAIPLSKTAIHSTVTSTGILIPFDVPVLECGLTLLIILMIVAGFVLLKTAKITKISPIEAIRGTYNKNRNNKIFPKINGKLLEFKLSVRQLFSSKRRYIAVFLTAVLLTFFASVTGRMYIWFGSDGKGMMGAFNPAEHDLGVQAIGDIPIEEMERVVKSYTKITDTYLLAMPNTAVNGIDCTANVITEPERFHILDGETCNDENQVVVTQFFADDLGVSIGDTLTISAGKGSENYIISGIYQCANDMGINIGMSDEGYLKIGNDDPRIWCYHYFLENPDLKYDITESLEAQFGAACHVHENTWPGLFGIITAMQGLLMAMYILTAVFILICTALTSSRILSAEQRDMGIYRAIGFTANRIRMMFSMRFAMTAAIGSAVGTFFACNVADTLINKIMNIAGIADFKAYPNILEIMFAAIIVTVMFTLFEFILSRKIKKVDMSILTSE